MSTNDAIVLQANFAEWRRRADDLGAIDPWLYYCFEQFLKPYALDDEETNSESPKAGMMAALMQYTF